MSVLVWLLAVLGLRALSSFYVRGPMVVADQGRALGGGRPSPDGLGAAGGRDAAVRGGDAVSHFRVVVHRLWLTVAALAFLVAFTVTGDLVLRYLHDSRVRSDVAHCLHAHQVEDSEGFTPTWDVKWGEECRINTLSSDKNEVPTVVFGNSSWG